jgi:plastocyanin
MQWWFLFVGLASTAVMGSFLAAPAKGLEPATSSHPASSVNISVAAFDQAYAAASDDGDEADVPTVFVRDNYYTPNRLTVPVGATVRWEHQGRIEHTVSSLLGYFDSGVLQPGDVFTYTFSTPGQYAYYCKFHITNWGTIVVE